MTDKSFEGDREHSKLSGFDLHLAKPIDSES